MRRNPSAASANSLYVGGKAVSYRQTPVDLMPYLQLPREAVAELVSIDPAREPVVGGILLSEEGTR